MEEQETEKELEEIKKNEGKETENLNKKQNLEEETEQEMEICFPAQILEYLFLGDYLHGEDHETLQQLGITHILNVQ